MTDLRNEWQGRVWAIRQMPRHWHLSTPTEWLSVARWAVWTAVKTLAIVAAVAVLLSVARGA